MKRFISIVLACALAPLAMAQMYKSVGPDGKVIYSDQPPASGDSKQITVQPGASAAPAAPKSAVERDKDAEKGRAEARDKAKKAEAVAKFNQTNETRCVQARGEYQTYVEGGKLAKTNEKGERVLMNDTEIEAERNRVRAVMEEACKK